MNPTNAIQAFVVQTLLADAGVVAIVADRVWDDIPSEPIYPYCSFGPSYRNRDDVECIRADEYFLQVDCYSNSQGRRDQINDLTDAIEDALHEADGDLGAHALVSFNVVQVRVLDDADGKKHGLVQIRARVERG